MMLRLNISELFKQTIQWIRKDKIIFAPYLLFSMAYSIFYSKFSQHYIQFPHGAISDIWLKSNLFKLGAVMAGLFFVGLLCKLMVVVMMDMLTVQKKIHVKSLLKLTIWRYPLLLLSLLVLILPIGIIFLMFRSQLMIYGQSASHFMMMGTPLVLFFKNFILFTILMIIFITWVLFVEFLPVIFTMEKANSMAAIIKTYHFMRSHRRLLIGYFIFNSFLRIFFAFLVLIVASLPLIGESVGQAFFQAIFDTFLGVMSVVLYKMLIVPDPVINIHV